MFLLFRNRRLEAIETAERERAQSMTEWAVEALVFGNGQRLGPLRWNNATYRYKTTAVEQRYAPMSI